ncbi:hypothetical protein U1Q18_009881, partial [Sarracenia purpurea var. burkii]
SKRGAASAQRNDSKPAEGFKLGKKEKGESKREDVPDSNLEGPEAEYFLESVEGKTVEGVDHDCPIDCPELALSPKEMVSDPTTQSTYEGNPEYREKEEGSVKVGRASKINSPPSGKGDFAETKGKGESGVDDDTGQGGETKKVSFASAPVSRICRDDQNVKGGDTNQPCEQPQGAAYAQVDEEDAWLTRAGGWMKKADVMMNVQFAAGGPFKIVIGLNCNWSLNPAGFWAERACGFCLGRIVWLICLLFLGRLIRQPIRVIQLFLFLWWASGKFVGIGLGPPISRGTNSLLGRAFGFKDGAQV